MQDPEKTSLDLWRLAADLSVVNAAILIAGGDPSEVDISWDFYAEGQTQTQRTDNHTGFRATFSALTSAIRRGHLPAQLAFRRISAGIADEEFWELSSQDVSGHLHGAEVSPFVYVENVYISREPDWSRSSADVEELKAWLKSRGFTDCFFFPPQEDVDSDEFMNPGHDHFAPELALAVAAWRALASERKFPRGPKTAVEAWIEANPDAWQYDGDLSASAKERITTLVNWKRGGGSPSSSG